MRLGKLSVLVFLMSGYVYGNNADIGVSLHAKQKGHFIIEKEQSSDNLPDEFTNPYGYCDNVESVDPRLHVGYNVESILAYNDGFYDHANLNMRSVITKVEEASYIRKMVITGETRGVNIPNAIFDFKHSYQKLSEHSDWTSSLLSQIGIPDSNVLHYSTHCEYTVVNTPGVSTVNYYTGTYVLDSGKRLKAARTVWKTAPGEYKCVLLDENQIEIDQWVEQSIAGYDESISTQDLPNTSDNCRSENLFSESKRTNTRGRVLTSYLSEVFSHN
ncbi:MAG: hypothetical protein HOO06_02605 [Bdellovibrionaceae bacterium]|jgi:hypothetical protein|nr:hypothetical protein [Pseudobdellovibrionaceae bacterium]